MAGWSVYRKEGAEWVKIAWIPDARAATEKEALAVVRRARAITAKSDKAEYKVTHT